MSREQSFDALYNEGCEGYNPYRGETHRPMYRQSEQQASVVSPTNDTLVMFRGLPQRKSKLVKDLADANARLAKITDQFAVELTTKQISELTAALA